MLVTCWSQLVRALVLCFPPIKKNNIPRVGSVWHLPYAYLLFPLQWRMDVERDEEAEPQGGWEWVKTQEEKMKKEREEVCICIPDCQYLTTTTEMSLA